MSKEKTTKVVIKSREYQKWSQITTSAMSAMRAAAELGDDKAMRLATELMTYGQGNFTRTVYATMEER